MIEDVFYKIAPIYQSSPQLIKVMIGTIYQFMPKQLNCSIYSKYKRLLNETEKWNRERLNDFQYHKIKDTINYAYNNIRFYRNTGGVRISS